MAEVKLIAFSKYFDAVHVLIFHHFMISYVIQAMKERHQEINIHKDMLNAQVRAVNEERQQISAELHERISKIDKLRKRWVFFIKFFYPMVYLFFTSK